MRPLYVGIGILSLALFMACSRGSSKSATTNSPSPKPKKKSCFEDIPRLTNIVQEVASRMEAQELMYGESPLSDCSGIFHRVLDSMKTRCPEGSYPSKIYRDSRSLAKWYHEQNNLRLVVDAEEMANLIQPGAVLFYGGREDKHSAEEINIAHLTSPGGINHVGIVTSIEKNASGELQNYHLFHGLRPGKYAKITNYHHRRPSRKKYPPFGNGTEALVAIAPVVSK